MGVLSAGAVATTLLTESVLAPKSLARFWMAAMSVAVILPGVAGRLVSAVCSEYGKAGAFALTRCG